MAHHQHHGSDYEAHVSNSLQTQSRPAGSVEANLPAISEDELAAEADEPPERSHQRFIKFSPRLRLPPRRESLLTKALHTDSESHDDEHTLKSSVNHNPSVSSTCSTFSNRSAGDFTSDDGHTSPGTRASTPSSPHSTTVYMERAAAIQRMAPKIQFAGRQSSDSSQTSQPESILKPAEPTIEAELGRKRCISFMCGGAKTPVPAPTQAVSAAEQPTVIEAPKRQCAIKFLCPSKVMAPKSPAKVNNRIHSPAPPHIKTSSSSSHSRRGHRDSDVTIKNASPNSASHSTTTTRHRRFSQHLYPPRTEATRFHEFGSSDDETEDWVQQSTCHRSRLTVSDTLKKENVIRQLAEEAEEEALEDEAEEDEDDFDDSQTDLLSGEDEDAGFQTDDEEGFAASDDDSDDDSDYEWWAPRRSPTASPFISMDIFRKSHPVGSESSYAISDTSAHSPKTKLNLLHPRPHLTTRPITIRPGSPELPDSTDFVCGTLDEDRPLEQAYITSKRHREAARHRITPQDIDPSFPTSDPEIEQDDEDEIEDGLDDKVTESDRAPLLAGRIDAIEESFRGRRVSTSLVRSPHPSPRRLRSPPAPIKRGRSPAPRGMFTESPKRLRSPPPPNRLTSPPPSRRGSYDASPAPINMSSFGPALLGSRNYDLTHTASLPRSPHPFNRRRRSSNATAIQDSPRRANTDDEEDSEATMEKPYARGAIDIVQGLECKRLKRREKLYKQYWKREEKKKNRRPQPGKGAERMRQVGIECAVYRGKRVLSI